MKRVMDPTLRIITWVVNQLFFGLLLGVAFVASAGLVGFWLSIALRVAGVLP
jgi:hypothetical protein